jgi:LemA protein
MGAQNIVDKGKTENMLASALKSVFAIAEAYPELKANQNFLSLQNELSDTENKSKQQEDSIMEMLEI